MIIDVHTHIFPPRMITDREALVRADAGFAALYADPRAKMATAEELLASMAEAGVDQSVACGFWWSSAALAAEHAAYLVASARASTQRIVPFVPLHGDTAIVDGTRGVGELRVGSGGTLNAATERNLAGAIALGLPVLAHCTEEAGHTYPGKTGGFTPGALWSFMEANPQARVIAAHWGGGFPFYALMPEVRAVIDAGRVVFDTAASSLLYGTEAPRRGIDLVGVGAVCWGSDFPLRDQTLDRAMIEASLPDQHERQMILGNNAARFLDLPARK